VDEHEESEGSLDVRAGPDPLFPYLGERDRFRFPDPERSRDGLVGVGGNLSPGMILSAYEQGIFPWYSARDPVLWHSPDPRFVLFPEAVHISASMRKVLKKGTFEIAFDRDFPAVIRHCAEAERPGQDGTWITAEMMEAYTELHELGWAHSAEAYIDGLLVGACYGLRLGAAFFGESMFALVANASKAAFLTLASTLFSDGVEFIDCQVPTEHLASLGGREIPRKEFLFRLENALGARRGKPSAKGGGIDEADGTAASDEADRRGDWGLRYPSYGTKR
jgi:leucyl/phenylalanyl-tRNA--protein transferase